ncbi:type II toxin-antitoxin system PemK/MazF family toxin [Litoribacter ruber]|uniref:type II toxin-antitoxin system PemK/MazF family toxin n=1 Tax=Litoribacter ruber TaxID=702568 RepID=UPI001BDA2CB4|nr:type II toxin-antitoxin system PemK/MazF family toxin [Litoribacter ruber]MBT0811914.1 type II toxin-antitoxin system PemK/MazF family toxin [Litoribacter ruber]
MRIRQFEIWIANLNPQKGTEPGKVRPVLVVQTNLLNRIEFPSTIICPITSNVLKNYEGILRVNIKEPIGRLQKESAILIDQVRAIDNVRLIEKLGVLPDNLALKVKENLKIVMDLE